MKVFFECELVAKIPVTFTARDSGDLVSYTELYFVNEDDEGKKQMLKFNSKGFDEVELGDVNIEVDVDPTGKQKPKLTSVTKVRSK